MAGITLEQAQAQLDKYLDMISAIEETQSVSSDSSSATYHDIDKINRQIEYWDKKVKILTQKAYGRGRARSVAPGW